MPILTVNYTGIIHESPLTLCEWEILHLMWPGLLKKEIANQLCISNETEKKHVQNSYHIIQVRNRIGALWQAS